MTLEQGKSSEHNSPAGNPYPTAPSPFQNQHSVGGSSGEITVPGEQTYDGNTTTEDVDFSALASLRQSPWADYRPPAGRPEVASEITAPATGETTQMPESTRTSETVGHIATGAATDYAHRLRLAIRDRDNGVLDTRLTPAERRTRELKIRDHLEHRPDTYENVMATTIIGRNSKVVLAGSERTTTDDTMTRTVVSVVEALESGNTPEKPQDTTVLVGHLAANTRHRTRLVDAAEQGAFNFLSADIKHAAGLLHALDARDTSAAIAEAVVGKDTSSSHKTVSDLHKRLTDNAQELLTSGRKPTPVDYRTILRVVSGEVPEAIDPGLYRKLMDVFPEKIVETNKNEIERLRVFYEELTRDTPREVAAKIESGQYPTSTLFNVGYEGFFTEAQDNLKTMLAAMQGMVSSSTPHGKPDLVVLTNGDRLSQDRIPMVVDLMAECDTQGVPVILTAGDYMEAHHEPLLIGTKVFGVHRVGTATAGLISKLSGLNPKILAENESRSLTGNKGANTGGGGNTGRGPGDAYDTSSGSNTSYGRSAGMAFGKSQQVRAGTPMMPPHEIESFRDREFGMWGPRVDYPAVYNIDSGLQTDNLPRHQIETIEVEADIRGVDWAEKPLVGGSHALGTADTQNTPQLERGSKRTPLRVDATLGGTPVPGATPQLNAPEAAQEGKATLPIRLPQTHDIGRRSLINQYSGAGNPFIGFHPSKKQLKDLADYARHLWVHQKKHGQTDADWDVWAHHWGVPGHEQRPNNPGNGRR